MQFANRCGLQLAISIAVCTIFSGLAVPEAVAITLPIAGVNPMGYSYYGTALPFVDVAHMSGRWMSAAAAGATSTNPPAVSVNATGYPSSLAAGQVARTLLFTHNGEVYPLGKYVLQWQGIGSVQLSGAGLSVTSIRTRQIVYNVTSTNSGGLYLDITSTDPANPVRNISVRAPFPGSAGTFNSAYQKNIANYGVLRFMGWNSTNLNTTSTWSARTTPVTFHWGGASGVPYEAQIELSNELKEDLWISVPHLADDDYVRNLAQLVQQSLAPGLRVWVEYSNEVWNSGYPQAAYANDVLRPKYGAANAPEAYGRRAAEVFDIFASQVANPSERLVRVIAGQNANSWVLKQALRGATVNGTLKADVAATAVYFSVDTTQLYQQFQQGTLDLNNVFVDLQVTIDTTIKAAAENQTIAAANNLPLISYEGGQHLVAKPGSPGHSDRGFIELLSQINRDPRMGSLYTYMLDEWRKTGGKTFVFVGDVAPASKWGAWGLQETYLDVNAAKFQAVQHWLEMQKSSRSADFN